MKVPEISVFLPAFNEESNIKKTILQVEAVLKEVALKYEIIVVNDGSSDKTGELCKQLSRENNRIRLVNHSHNRGYGGAFKSGLYSARYLLIAQMDSDGQFDFSQIKKFLGKIENAGMVIGYRQHRTDSPYRRFMANILWLADLILFGLKVKDVDCGFKLFHKEILNKIAKLRTESAITVTEFIVRAKNSGASIVEVGVDHYSRKAGEQTGGKPGIIIKAALQGILLWFYLITEREWKK